MCVTHGVEYDDTMGCIQCAAHGVKPAVPRLEKAPLNPNGRYYLQDARGSGVVGNCLLWWAKDHAGYTCDLGNAHVFTKADLEKLKLDRGSDVPWPKDYVDAHVVTHVDHQRVNRHAATAEDEIKHGCPWGHDFGHGHDLSDECDTCPEEPYQACAHRYCDIMTEMRLASEAVKTEERLAREAEPDPVTPGLYDDLMRDERPPKDMWAPGMYCGECSKCSKRFIGDKRATTCAPCAYGDTAQ